MPPAVAGYYAVLAVLLLISSFTHFTGHLCDGSILFGVEGYGAYFVFWGGFVPLLGPLFSIPLNTETDSWYHLYHFCF